MNDIMYYRTVALMLCIITVLIPVNSAAAAAGITITKVTGTDGVDNFVNANGDTIRIEATVSGQVNEQDLKVNHKDYSFNSCQNDVTGTQCVYESTFRQLYETSYPINVMLYDGNTLLETASSSITADGSEPEIKDLVIEQRGTSLHVTMNVKDKPGECSGLSHVIVYADNTQIARYDNFDSACDYNDLDESISLPYTSSGEHNFKVTAIDSLGLNVSSAQSLFIDMVPPVINANTFHFSEGYNGFAKTGEQSCSFSVEVREDTLPNVTAVVNGDTFSGKCDYLANTTYLCEWTNVDLTLEGTFSVQIKASDNGKNTVSRTFPLTFSTDNTAPFVDFFGTIEHDNEHYVSLGLNTVVAIFTETQSGLTPDLIKADLASLNPAYLVPKSPDECTQNNGKYVCYWQVNVVRDPGTIRLVQVEDRVGNRVTVEPEQTLTLDRDPPVIDLESVTVTSLHDNGERNYLQDSDIALIRFSVTESNGLLDVHANVNGLVSGQQNVTAQCDVTDNLYSCVVETGRVRSGYVANARFDIVAVDSAGNRHVVSGSKEILAADGGVTQRDFWETSQVSCSPSELDINTVSIVPQRIFCEIRLSTQSDEANVLATELLGCEGDTQFLQTSFMLNNFQGNRNPMLVLELAQFSENVTQLSYNCSLNVYTKRGNTVIQIPEQESANATVTFYETKFSRDLEGIEDKIKDVKDKASTGFYGVIKTLNQIFFWAKWLCAWIPILDKVAVGFRAFNLGFEPLRHTAFGVPAAISACYTTDQASSYIYLGVMPVLKEVCAIATCRAGAWGQIPGIGEELGAVQGGWAQAWGMWSGDNIGEAIGVSSDPYDNLPSAIGQLCIPGIIYNLEKLRQIECRYAYCLESEVKAGVASIEACRQLKDYQECKYIWGNLFQLIPFVPALTALFNKVTQILTDPVGAFRLAALIGCNIDCTTSNSWYNFCNIAATLFFVTDAVNDVMALVEQPKTINKDLCSEIGA